MRSFSLDYRLAPEHPFPAAIDDGVSAYRDLLDQGLAPASIAFAGDSAGGGLCITTCLKTRSEGRSLAVRSPPPSAVRPARSPTRYRARERHTAYFQASAALLTPNVIRPAAGNGASVTWKAVLPPFGERRKI